ncbi:PAS domain S-box-containing protein [Pseudarcicella hirudinis]|uniref:histidine kinase n=2 Tax=Pseudarcicella hirudinis TaxID=1079859 RepID=A0A1I5WCH6_9BACT|nr:PAS domain S-box-containing protein [Pseudarcicella hirudinis]
MWSYTRDAYTSMFFSEDILEVTGYQPNEFIQNPALFPEIVFEEDKNLFLTHREAVNHNSRNNLKYRIITRSGEIRSITEKTFTRFDENNSVITVTGFVTWNNPNKSRKTEQKIQKSIINSQEDFICTFSPDLTVKFHNTSFIRFCNRQPDEINASNILSYFPDFVREKIKINIRKLSNSEQAGDIVFKIVNAEKDTIWLRLIILPIYNAQNQLWEFHLQGSDITDLKKSQEILKSQTAEFEAIIENPHISIIVLSKNYELELFNKTFESFIFKLFNIYPKIGYSINRFFIDLAQKQFFAEQIDRCFNGEYFTAVLRTDISDHSYYFEHSFNPVIEDGKVEKISIVTRDVTRENIYKTELNKTTGRLTHSQFLLNKILENLPESAVYVLDKDLRLLFSAGEELSKYNLTPENLQGKLLEECFSPETSAYARALFYRVFNGERFTDIKELGDQTFENIFTPVFNEQHEISLALLYSRNITEKVLSKQANWELQEKFLTAFNYAPIGKALVSKDGKFMMVNPALCQFLGYTEAELLNITFQEITHPDDLEKDWDLVLQVLNGEINSYQLEKRYFTKNKKVIWSLLNVSKAVDAHGNFLHFISQIQDITRQKEYEEELIIAKNKAEEAANAKASFLSIMTHEIRTPLNSVIGFSNLLDYDPKSPDGENIKLLKYSAETLLDLINDILDFSKIDAGKIVLFEEVFDFRELLMKLRNSFQFKADEKGLELKVIIDEEIPAHLKADLTRIKQIFNNLMGNALKFTEKGSVVIKARLHKIEDDICHIDITFEDTGIGIASEKLVKIFEVFSQADENSTRKYGGTGLGLSITQKLVHLINGTIEVNSTLGKGSIFRIQLPFRKADTSIEVKHPSLFNDDLTGIRVLVAEDNLNNFILVDRFLKKWGGTAENAPNGKIALEMLEHKSYDVILMDTQMPEMDGYQATRAIRNSTDSRISGIPIIGFSATPKSELIVHGEKVEMDGYIGKPFLPMELFQLLRSVSKHQLVSES